MKPRFLKSIHTLGQEPVRDSSTIQNILLRDIAGYKGNDIAKELKLTPARISIIRNSPLYVERRSALWTQMKDTLVDKKTDGIVEEEVRKIARKSVKGLTHGLVSMAENSENPFAQLAATKEVYKRAGMDSVKEVEASITIDAKLSERLGRVADYDESRKNDGRAKITITEKIST